jgi:hypothetical protein
MLTMVMSIVVMGSLLLMALPIWLFEQLLLSATYMVQWTWYIMKSAINAMSSKLTAALDYLARR